MDELNTSALFALLKQFIVKKITGLLCLSAQKYVIIKFTTMTHYHTVITLIKINYKEVHVLLCYMMFVGGFFVCASYLIRILLIFWNVETARGYFTWRLWPTTHIIHTMVLTVNHQHVRYYLCATRKITVYLKSTKKSGP
jgi:hypothetical protein